MGRIQLTPPVSRGFISRSLPISIIFLTSVAAAAAPQGRACDYQSAQQMFDLQKFTLDGCFKLKSLAQIFGDGPAIGAQAWKLTATRFITATLVFTGSVTHVRKDQTVPSGTAYEVVVQPRCFIKGRLQLPGRDSSVTVTGFQPSVETGLCLPISAEVGNVGLFFTTVTGGLKGSPVIQINENGFVKENAEVKEMLNSLLCQENAHSLTPVPVHGDAGPNCHPVNASSPPCSMSLDTAKEFLRRAFINYEADLKSECQLGQEAVVQMIVKAPTGQLDGTKAGQSMKYPCTSWLAEMAALIYMYMQAQILAI